MRRIKVLVLCLMFLTGGCKTLHSVGHVVGDVVVAGAVVAGAAILHHSVHHHGHHGHYRHCD